MKISVETSYCDDFIIQEDRLHEDTLASTDTYQVLSQTVLRLREEGVRKALIDLGWTPPVKDK